MLVLVNDMFAVPNHQWNEYVQFHLQSRNETSVLFGVSSLVFSSILHIHFLRLVSSFTGANKVYKYPWDVKSQIWRWT